MSTEKVKLILNNVLLALQLCLGVWQFMKLTPVGALIQGVVGWLLRPLGFSPTYYGLQHCPGRVFKRANCFMLQTDIPSERRDISRDEVNTINLDYLGSKSLLERKGTDGNMLFVNKKMCYYITPTIWNELRTLEDVLNYGLAGPPNVRAELACARAKHLHAAADVHRAAAADAAAASSAAAAAAYKAADRHFAAAASSAATAAAYKAADRDFAAAAAAAYKAADRDFAAAAAEVADCNFAAAVADCCHKLRDADAVAADADAAIEADRAANRALQILFVRGNRQFWKEMITGGVMTLEEVFDAIILNNEHVSVRLNNDWLLPVNLSVSEERLLKILNLIALFLQIKTLEVHWFIPIPLSFISALLEFSTKVRVLLYTKINMLFCHIVHFICDPLPYACRQQVYSLGKWVENLTPCNDIQLKVVRGNISAIITEGAKVAIITEGAKVENLTPCNDIQLKVKVVRGNISIITKGAKVEVGAIITEDAEVDQEGAIMVPWLGVPDDEEGTLNFGFIEKKFSCNPTDITCTYLTGKQVCEISAPTISEFYVKCKNDEDFSHIITFVSCIAENRCGSLISYGLNKKVRVRGFEKSITSYVNNGLPSVYQLELVNVVVA